MPQSDYLRNKLIDGTLRNTQYTVPATVYVALYTSDPTVNDVGVEVSGGGYARQSCAFSAPSAGVSTNSADITFPVATSSYGTVTHFGIRDASTAGNLLYFAPLSASKTVSTDNQLLIKAGQLSVAMG